MEPRAKTTELGAVMADYLIVLATVTLAAALLAAPLSLGVLGSYNAIEVLVGSPFP